MVYVCRSVYLCLHEATPCPSLRLQLRGYEISEYDYQFVEQVDEDTYLPRLSQRKAKKDILRADLKLIEYPGNWVRVFSLMNRDVRVLVALRTHENPPSVCVCV